MSRIFWITICVCILAGGATWMGCALFGQASPSDVERPDTIAALTVDPSALDVGEIDEGTTPVFRLPIRNQTSEAIHVRDFVFHCTCLSIEPRSFTIPAGDTIDVRLPFSLPARTPADVGLARRPFEYAVTPLHGGGKRHPGACTERSRAE